MRAAEVTEKASRVAPLVNSWQFDHDDGDCSWMDPGRQYAVQYMNQSRAGQGLTFSVFLFLLFVDFSSDLVLFVFSIKDC